MYKTEFSATREVGTVFTSHLEGFLPAMGSTKASWVKEVLDLRAALWLWMLGIAEGVWHPVGNLFGNSILPFQSRVNWTPGKAGTKAGHPLLDQPSKAACLLYLPNLLLFDCFWKGSAGPQPAGSLSSPWRSFRWVCLLSRLYWAAFIKENSTGAIKQYKYRGKDTISFYPVLQVLGRAEGRRPVKGLERV